MARIVIYECAICDCYHPWTWNGDCRDDANRFGDPEEYAERNSLDPDTIEVRSMDDRRDADDQESAEQRATWIE